MNPDDIAFLQFGLLPEVSIHTLFKDEWSDLYIPREKCECGCKEWIESTMKMFAGYYAVPVHRCKMCNKVRVADHISKGKG